MRQAEEYQRTGNRATTAQTAGPGSSLHTENRFQQVDKAPGVRILYGLGKVGNRTVPVRSYPEWLREQARRRHSNLTYVALRCYVLPGMG